MLAYKNFDMEKYISDVLTLPFSIINTFKDPNEQLGSFNNTLLSVINENVYLERVKLTRLLALWSLLWQMENDIKWHKMANYNSSRKRDKFTTPLIRMITPLFVLVTI